MKFELNDAKTKKQKKKCFSFRKVSKHSKERKKKMQIKIFLFKEKPINFFTIFGRRFSYRGNRRTALPTFGRKFSRNEIFPSLFRRQPIFSVDVISFVN